MIEELLTAIPTAERLLELMPGELERVLLRYVVTIADDPMRRTGVTSDGILTELFAPLTGYDMRYRDDVRKAVSSAWQSLENARLIEEPDDYNGKNGYRIASNAGKAAKTDVDFNAAKVRGWLIPELLHKALHGPALRAFAAADYGTADFEAFKSVEIAVRTKGGFGASDFGVALMKKAFDPKNGPLRDKSAPPARRQARMNLFAGAMGEIRNPKGHADPTITDPQVAIEELMTASLLLRIVG
jgi:uncharacterized protein (TIGR02391 family)